MSDLQFKRADLQSKYSADQLKSHKEVIEVAGAPKMIKGIQMPAKKEQGTVYKHEGLVYLDLTPSLADKTLYSLVRTSASPLKTLLSVIEGASKKLT